MVYFSVVQSFSKTWLFLHCLFGILLVIFHKGANIRKPSEGYPVADHEL